MKAQLQGLKCPKFGYDYGPFARPFFEGAKRRSLRLECAACFQRFVMKRDGSTSIKERKEQLEKETES